MQLDHEFTTDQVFTPLADNGVLVNGPRVTLQDDVSSTLPEDQDRVFAMCETLEIKAVKSVGGCVVLEFDRQYGSAFRFIWPTNNPDEVAQ